MSLLWTWAPCCNNIENRKDLHAAQQSGGEPTFISSSFYKQKHELINYKCDINVFSCITNNIPKALKCVCLLWYFVPPLSRIVLLIGIHNHCRWRAAKLDLCSALKAIEQWGFLSVPHILGYGASVFMNISENPRQSNLSSVELSQPVLTT